MQTARTHDLRLGAHRGRIEKPFERQVWPARTKGADTGRLVHVYSRGRDARTRKGRSRRGLGLPQQRLRMWSYWVRDSFGGPCNAILTAPRRVRAVGASPPTRCEQAQGFFDTRPVTGLAPCALRTDRRFGHAPGPTRQGAVDSKQRRVLWKRPWILSSSPFKKCRAGFLQQSVRGMPKRSASIGATSTFRCGAVRLRSGATRASRCSLLPRTSFRLAAFLEAQARWSRPLVIHSARARGSSRTSRT